MKVLASVYACSPYDGSERAVGWNWITELDKYHMITAITSYKYKNDIEDYCHKNPDVLQNTRFIYVDVPNTEWHMAVFYWISGYLFKNKEQPFKCFIKNKLKRLLIPYWVYGVALTFIGTIVFVRKKRCC